MLAGVQRARLPLLLRGRAGPLPPLRQPETCRPSRQGQVLLDRRRVCDRADGGGATDRTRWGLGEVLLAGQVSLRAQQIKTGTIGLIQIN